MRKDNAKQLFHSGYNCAQAVSCAYADQLGLSVDKVASLTCPFGAGMARSRQICGAVSGMLMVIGARYPDKSKAEIYDISRQYMDEFAQQFGSVICQQLLSGVGLNVDTDVLPEQRTDKYYSVRPCAEYVAFAAQLIDIDS